MPRDVYIVGCVRSPIGRGTENGILHSVHPIDLYAKILDELVKRTNVNKAEVEDIITGCVTPMQQQVTQKLPQISEFWSSYSFSIGRKHCPVSPIEGEISIHCSRGTIE
jgi:acetyl-CoA acetyltransferase